MKNKTNAILPYLLKRGRVMFDRRRYEDTTYTWIRGLVVFNHLTSISSGDPFPKLKVSEKKIYDCFHSAISNDAYKVCPLGTSPSGALRAPCFGVVKYTGAKY